MSSSTLDSIDFLYDDILEDTEQLQEEPIDFFLKIPPRESRLNRGSHREHLSFTKEHQSRPKRKKGIIQALLTQKPILVEKPTI
jgi:hypothetical protein